MSDLHWIPEHAHRPDTGFDGGAMDCGNGLLLEIRRHLNALDPGGLLEVRSTEPSVAGDLPAWSRLTGNDLVSSVGNPRLASYLICKGKFSGSARPSHVRKAVSPRVPGRRLAVPPGAPATVKLPPLAVTGIGSWPRPAWMLHLLAGALTLSIFTYVFVNMGMVSGILPVVRVPLPFVSYGGTAFVTLSLGVGTLMSIQRHRKLVQT